MSRPCKAVNTQSAHLTKEQKANRTQQENKLKGSVDKITPPDNLSKEQRKIFRYIVKELENSKILGNLDVYILSQCSISIDRLQQIEDMINKDRSLLMDSKLMSSKEKYSKDFFRCCNELSLSPQSRAKMAGINIQSAQDANDPLLAALSKGNDTK